jgi:hypothetical protein
LQNKQNYANVYNMNKNAFPKIQFDKLLGMQRGTVVEPIPSAEHDKHYLRGASLGTLAINLAYGVNRVNPRNNLRMHVAPVADGDSYQYTRNHARALAEYGLPHHFNDEERAVLSELVGRYVDHAPAIIFGIPKDNENVQFVPNTSHGLIVANEVTFGDLDPHSQEAMSEIFGVDVASLPCTPGAQGPDFAPPKRPRLGG